MKFLAKLICCFIPVKKWRKVIRYRLYEKQAKYEKHIARLSKMGPFEIKEMEGAPVVSIQNLNLANVFDGDAMVVVEEIFNQDEYHFYTAGNPVVIDVGMNVGLASLAFARQSEVKHVYGFEPFAPTFKQAELNFRINPELSNKISPHNYGLGDQEKELVFEYYAKAPGQMSTVKRISETHPWRQDETVSEKVLIKPAASEIKSIIERHPDSPIVLKCDTEGAELEIFTSLEQAGLLSRFELIMLEYHFSYDKPIIKLLEKNGFSFFKQKVITLETGDFGMIRAVKKT